MSYSANSFPEKESELHRLLHFELLENGEDATFYIDGATTPEDFEHTLGYLQYDETLRQQSRDRLLKNLIEERGLLNRKTLVLEEISQEATEQSHIESRVFLTFKDNPKLSDLTEALHICFDDEEKEMEERNKILHKAIKEFKLADVVVKINLDNQALQSTTGEASPIERFDRASEEFFKSQNKEN